VYTAFKGRLATVQRSMRTGMCTVFGRHKNAKLGLTEVAGYFNDST